MLLTLNKLLTCLLQLPFLTIVFFPFQLRKVIPRPLAPASSISRQVYVLILFCFTISDIFCVNSIDHVAGSIGRYCDLSLISQQCKLLNNISEKSSTKGYFLHNKRKFECSVPSQKVSISQARLIQTTTVTRTRASPIKRFNERNGGSARALKIFVHFLGVPCKATT